MNLQNIYSTRTDSSRLKNEENFPRVVLIDTTNYCIIKCSMCIHKNMTRKKGTMSWELYKKVIDEIAEIDRNIRVWLVFFGEPLLLKKAEPSIFKFISYAKDKGLTDVVLNSNGNLLDEESARNLIISGLDALYIGIDAFRADTYNRIRVNGDYKKVVNNVIRMQYIKQTMNAEKPDLLVQFVEMGINREEINDFIAFWNAQGITVKIRPKVSWAGHIAAENLVLNNIARWPCYWAMQTMSIINDGRVVMCAVDLDAQYIAGDVNKESLRGIWNGEMRHLRQLHESKNFAMLPPNCSKCKDWQAADATFYLAKS